MNKYFHIPTSSPIAEYITGIWEIDGGFNVRETILPKGIVEIIFNFADGIHAARILGTDIYTAPKCFIQGLNTSILNVQYLGKQHLLGIRLPAYRVQDLLGIIPAELCNTTIDLSLIDPLFDHLWSQLVEAKNFEEKVKILERVLPCLPDKGNIRTQTLNRLFLKDGINNFRSVDELAREVCYSTRQLNRITRQLFGLSAEELVAYKKFVEAVKLLHIEHESLTDIAFQSGFYDQSHFCRVFKPFTGMTARQYLQQKSDLPFHIFSA